MAKIDDNQKKLQAFLKRRHPEYAETINHWEFVEACYEGGREWFIDNIFQYVKEGDKEFKNRRERAYRFNHSKEVVDLVDKYIFKMSASRAPDAPKSVKAFWKSATLDNLKIKDYMRDISRMSSIFGRVWIVVDNNKQDVLANATEVKTSVSDDKNEAVKTYSYIVTPKNVLDMSYDDEGCLNWILIHEQVRDDEDPLSSSGEMQDRYRLWEKDQWTVFNVETISGKKVVVADGPYVNALGIVPVFAADNVIGNELYCATGLIDDVAYLDKAVANYLSNLDAIIQDQTFSQLVMPAQSVLPGESAHGALTELGTSRMFTYNAEGGGAPSYISPDVKQPEFILRVVNKIINEIYHSVGLAGERTKEDNSMGIDNSSGVAKAYDFERVNSLLTTKADSLEVTENKLAYLVAKWNGEEDELASKIDEEDGTIVSYPDNFDVRGLYDEFDIAARLSLVEAPDDVRRLQMENVIDKLFPKMERSIRDSMISGLKSWPPKIDPLAVGGEQTGTQVISKSGKNSVANKLVKTK